MSLHILQHLPHSSFRHSLISFRIFWLCELHDSKREIVFFFFPSPYWICYNAASVWCFGRVLVPQPRIELAPSALEGEILTSGLNTREVPRDLPELAFLLSYQKPYLSFWFWKNPTQTRDKQEGGSVIFREIKRVESWGRQGWRQKEGLEVIPSDDIQ